MRLAAVAAVNSRAAAAGSSAERSTSEDDPHSTHDLPPRSLHYCRVSWAVQDRGLVVAMQLQLAAAYAVPTQILFKQWRQAAQEQSQSHASSSLAANTPTAVDLSRRLLLRNPSEDAQLLMVAPPATGRFRLVADTTEHTQTDGNRCDEGGREENPELRRPNGFVIAIAHSSASGLCRSVSAARNPHSMCPVASHTNVCATHCHHVPPSR